MARIVCAMYGAAGYIVAAVAGYFLVTQLSTNVHDREIEAAMTGAFFIGPVGALLAFVAGMIRYGREGSVSAHR